MSQCSVLSGCSALGSVTACTIALTLILLLQPSNVCFCREEIQRLKLENPRMTHKEAFGIAADQVSWLLLFVKMPSAHYMQEGDGAQWPLFDVFK